MAEGGNDKSARRGRPSPQGLIPWSRGSCYDSSMCLGTITRPVLGICGVFTPCNAHAKSPYSMDHRPGGHDARGREGAPTGAVLHGLLINAPESSVRSSCCPCWRAVAHAGVDTAMRRETLHGPDRHPGAGTRRDSVTAGARGPRSRRGWCTRAGRSARGSPRH